MPRSTRQKSSKNRDARDYSDSSDKESSLKEKKSNSDKRKLESKEYYDSINGEYYTSSSKRRKGKSDEEKGESSKKSKASNEKSRRREDEEGKKSSVKSDGKHRESSRKQSKEIENDRERDKKHKEESKSQDHVRSPGTENYKEKRSRRKRDDHGTGDRHQDNSDDVGDRLFASGDDCSKDGKQKGEKCRDKYPEDKEEDIKRKGDKQREDRPTKEHSRSDDKLLREEGKKYSKDSDHGHDPDSELDGYHDRERNRDYDRNERDRERARDRDRDRDRDRRDYEHDRYHDRDRDRSRDRDRDHDRDRTHDREKDHSRDYYHDGKRSKSDRGRDNDRDVLRLDDQSGRYKERREGRRSPDYQDYQEVIKGSRSSRSERQPSIQEENGNVPGQVTRGVSSREAAELSGGSERGTRLKVSEKPVKIEDGVLGEFPAERSTATKASPRHIVERSPSSTSFDKGYNRNNTRDFSAAEGEKLMVDEPSQAESSFNNKANQHNSSFPPRPESRSGISSPRVGAREEDNRVNTGGRYKRGVDVMMGRGQGNVWRGVPSWPSPLPNGFIPFPPHGGFQAMMPQFPSSSLFRVRPSMEMNHPGIPYHIPDAERFSGHMRPLGWQNMMDGSGASSHMHGFFGDMSNSVFRDESNMYGGSEWDHNRRMHNRGWESSADRNGDASMEVSSISAKDDNNSAQVADDESLGGQTSHSDNNRAKSVEAGSNLTSPAKETHASSPKIIAEVKAEDLVTETIDNSERYCRHYLSKLNVSAELVDPELLKRIRSLLMDEEHLTIDDGTTVFVNLKEGGKRVPKSNTTSLAILSLFPSQNISVFQIAMDLYKEQRFEIKSLPIVESFGPREVSPSNLVEVDNNEDVNDAVKGNTAMETSHVGGEMKIETQDEGSSSPNSDEIKIETEEGSSFLNPDKSPEALQDAEAEDEVGVEQTMKTAPENIESYEQDAEAEDGADVEQTMKTAPENIESYEQEAEAEEDGADVEQTMKTAPGNDGDSFIEETEEKKEGVVFGDVSLKVTEPLVHESDESVISRIH